MTVALVLIALATVMALVLGIVARSQHQMNLEQWTVGGRRFGAGLVFLLMAGEIYTTFTFLGATGFAYGLGAPSYYILCYFALAYVISYFMLPKIWSYARQHALVSQPDFFAHKFDSPALGVLVASVGVVALVPYLVLQFTGLGVIVQVASYGAVPKTVSIIIGAAVVTLYVIISGIRGSAWTAVVKDIMIIGVAVFLGLYLPIHYFGGMTRMFEAVNAAKPSFFAFPSHGQSLSWFVSTTLLTALGFFMWPHYFGAIFTARNAAVFRKNAVILPIYQVMVVFVLLVGFTATLVVPGLKGAAINMALLKITVAAFPPWMVGIVGAAGVLTALVPGSLIMMSAATVFSRNIVGALTGGQSNDATVRLAKIMVPVVAVIGCYFAIAGSSTIVALLLMGYNFVTQLFPVLICSLMRRNPATTEGAFAGIIAGVATVVYFTLAHQSIGTLMPALPEVIKDINVGFAALFANVVAIGLVSLATAGRRGPVAKQVAD